MYAYELHLHTAESSRCGHVPAAEQVRVYKALGYAGVCVTDHLHDGYYEPSLDGAGWREAMERYLRGYRAAKAAGDAPRQLCTHTGLRPRATRSAWT